MRIKHDLGIEVQVMLDSGHILRKEKELEGEI